MCAERTMKYENKKNHLNPNILFDILPHHTIDRFKSFFSEGAPQRLGFRKGVNFCSESLCSGLCSPETKLSDITPDS